MASVCVSAGVRIDSRKLTIVALAALALAGPTAAQVKNGFDVADALIPYRGIIAGGPPRDGVPALTDPARETVENYVRDCNVKQIEIMRLTGVPDGAFSNWKYEPTVAIVMNVEEIYDQTPKVNAGNKIR